MRTVHKFLVPSAAGLGHGNPPMPAPVPQGAKIVHVGCDPRTHDPAIWVEVADYAVEPVGRTFAFFGTGDEIPAGWTHVGSTITPGAQFVWHVYEQVQK